MHDHLSLHPRGGFFLGIRHATDLDHVVAVTTIVSNQRNRARASLVGAFWGVGHTVTIFVVGAGIILFNFVIPVPAEFRQVTTLQTMRSWQGSRGGQQV